RGPTPMFRPALPNCWMGELALGMTWAKAALLSHAAVLFGPEFGFWPETTLGRLAEKPVISGAPPWLETSVESKTVKGVPLISVAMPLSCHPPSTACVMPAD